MGKVVKIASVPASPRAAACWAVAESRRAAEDGPDEATFAERLGRAVGSVVISATTVRQIEREIVEPSGAELVAALRLAGPAKRRIALQLAGD